MPFDRAFYPVNWDQISFRVRAAANWRCARCDRPCRKPGEDWESFLYRLGWDGAELNPRHYIIQTAHLDQNSQNNSPANLAALCTLCHFAIDRRYRLHNQYQRRERRGQLSLLKREPIAPPTLKRVSLVPPTLAGQGKDVNRIQLSIEYWEVAVAPTSK